MTTETPTPAKSTLRPCTCRRFEIGDFDPEQDGYQATTECERTTKLLFAQGHDAKLVSFLVNAELDGYEIRTTEGGMSITFPGSVAAAKSISEPLGVKAENMLAKAKERAEAKAKREAEKKAKKDAAAEQKQAAKQPEAPAVEPTAEAKPARRRRTSTKAV